MKKCGDNFLADYEKAQKKVDELKSDVVYQTNYIERLETDLLDYDFDIKKAVKDTAKEILQMIDSHLREQNQFIINKTQGGSVYKCAIAEIKLLIKERYGVEVE